MNLVWKKSRTRFAKVSNNNKTRPLQLRIAASLMLLAAQVVPQAALAAGTPPTSVPSHSVLSSSTTASGSSTFKSPNLNLSSTQASVSAAKSGTILLGGQLGAHGQITGATPISITKGMLLTPAENAALWQATSGGQHLLLSNLPGELGAADGGAALLNSSWASNLSSLVVPKGVTVDMVGFNASHPLNVANSGNILGSVYTLQSAPGLTATLNFGANLQIGAGALLSASLPGNSDGINLSGLYASQNLNLNVSGNFANHGMVTVPGTLNLNVGNTLSNTSSGTVGVSTGISGNSSVATINAQNINILSGSGNIVNSGLISATNNININTALATTDLNVNGNGTYQAQSGNINFRDASYAGAANINLSGGNFLSQNLNLYSGTGAINGNIGQVSGKLNSNAAVEHLFASTSNFVLGNNSISGDPTFANTGDITISGANTFGEDLTIVAGGNIYSDVNNPGSILDSGNAVTLIAGATITGVSSGSSISGSPSTGVSSVTVSFGSNGGNIDLRNSSNLGIPVIDTSSANGDGGNVTLIANSNGAGTGQVLLPTSSTPGSFVVDTSSSVGNGGSLSIIAGGNPANGLPSVQVGNIKTSSATNLDGTNSAVSIYTIQPTISIGGSTGAVATYGSNGDINNGAVFTPLSINALNAAGTITTGDIVSAGAGGAGGAAGLATGGIVAGQAGGNAGNISMRAGAAINTGNLLAYGGGGGGGGRSPYWYQSPGGAGGNGGSIYLSAGTNFAAGTGTISITGDLNSSGGGGGGEGGNASPSSAGGGAGGSAQSITVTAVGPVSITGHIYAVDGGAGGSAGSGYPTAGNGAGGGGGSFGGGGGGGGASISPDNGGGGGGGYFGGGAGGSTGAGGGDINGGAAGGTNGASAGSLGQGGSNYSGSGGSLGNGGLAGMTPSGWAQGQPGANVPGWNGAAASSTQNNDISIYGASVTLSNSVFGRNVSIGASTLSNTSILVAGSITATGYVSISSGGYSAGATGSNIVINSNVSSQEAIYVEANGSIFSSALLTAPSLSLYAAYNIGSPSAPINTQGLNLSAYAYQGNAYLQINGDTTLAASSVAGSVFASSSGQVTLAANANTGASNSAAGSFNLSAANGILQGDSNSISAAAITLYSSNGSVGSTGNPILTSSNSNSPLNLTASAQNGVSIYNNGDVSLVSNQNGIGIGSTPSTAISNGSSSGTWVLAASGNIFQGDSSSISAPAVTLFSMNGQIGAPGQPVLTSSTGAAPLNLTASAAESVTIFNNGDVSLVANQSGIEIGNNGSGAITNTAGTGLPFSLAATGNIFQGDSSSISALNIVLWSENGQIGTPAQPVLTSGSSVYGQPITLTASAQNSVNIFNYGDVWVSAVPNYVSTGSNGSSVITNNSNSGTWLLGATGAIAQYDSSTITAPSIVLLSTGGSIATIQTSSNSGSPLNLTASGQNYVSINVSGDVSLVSYSGGIGSFVSGPVTNSSSNGWYLAADGNILQGDGSSISAHYMELSSANGQIGAFGQPVLTTASGSSPLILRTSAQNSISILNTGDVSLSEDNANSGTLTIAATGNIFGAGISAPSVVLWSINGQIGSSTQPVSISSSKLTASAYDSVTILNASASHSGSPDWVTHDFANITLGASPNAITGSGTINNSSSTGVWTLASTGNISQGDSSSISAPAVTLWSINGSVGTSNQPILTTSNGSSPLNLVAQGQSGVTIFNYGDVALASDFSGINIPVQGSPGPVFAANSTNNTWLLAASGNIFQGSGSAITAQNVVLASVNGQIGTLSQPILTGYDNGGNGNLVLTAQAQNSVYVSAQADIYVGAYFNGPNINGVGFNINNTSNSGTWSLTGIGNIFQADNSSINAPTVSLQAVNTIGVAGSPINTQTANLSANAGASAFVQNIGSVVLGTSSAGAGQVFSLSTVPDSNGNGAIVISGNVNAGTINLNSSSSGQGNGGIQQSGSATLTANSINLADTGSSIAVAAEDIGSTTAPINTQASTITASTSGNIWLNNTGALNLTANSSGASVNVTNTGNVTIQNANSAASTYSVSTTPDANGNGQILIAGNIGSSTNPVNVISLSSSSSGSGAGGIQNTGAGGILYATLVTLSDTGTSSAPNAEDVGSAVNPISINAGRVITSTSGKSYFQNTGTPIVDILLPSLDFTNSTVIADLQNDIAGGYITGNIVLGSNGQIQTGSITLQPDNLSGTSVDDIPAGLTVTMQSFGQNGANLNFGSTTIAGTENFVNGGNFGYQLMVSSLNVSGSLNADNRLMIQAQGGVLLSGTGTISSSGTLYLNSNSSIVQQGTGALISAPSINLWAFGNIGSAGAPVYTKTANLGATSYGDMSLFNTGGASLNLTSYGNMWLNNASPSNSTAVNLGASASGNMSIANTGALNLSASSGGSVNVSNIGNVTIQGGNSAATIFSVTTTPDQNGNGAIFIAGNIGSNSNFVPTINLSSSSSGTGAGGIQLAGNGGTIYGLAVNLTDTGSSSAPNAQDIGSVSNPINVQAQSVTSTTNGLSYIVNAGYHPNILLPSLDFTNSTVIADLQNDIAGGYITGNIVLGTNGQIQTGSITLQPDNLAGTSVDDIPAGLTVTMQSFGQNGANLNFGSTTIAGIENFVNGGNFGYQLMVSSLNVSGTLSADNRLMIQAQGGVLLTGTGTISSSSTLYINSNSNIVQQGTGALISAPSINLWAFGNIGSAGAPVYTKTASLGATSYGDMSLVNTGGASLNLTSYGNMWLNNTSPSYSTAVNLGASASGNMSIVNTGALNLSASSGGSVNVSNIGNVTIQGGNSAATTFSVTTTPDQNGNGAIYIAGNIGSNSNFVPTVNLSSSSSGTGAGGIQLAGNGGTIYGLAVNLTDTGSSSAPNAQDIGSVSNPISVQAQSVTSTTNGLSYVVNAGYHPNILLPSLDFTNSTVIADLQNDISGGYITGNIVLGTNGQIQTGSITLQPDNLAGTSVDDIPAGLTVTMQSFGQNGANLNFGSTTIAGTENFVNGGNFGYQLMVSSLNVSGTLSADNRLMIQAQGGVLLSGTGTISSSSTLYINSNSSIVQQGTGALISAPSINLWAFGNIGSAGAPVYTKTAILGATSYGDMSLVNTGGASLNLTSYGNMWLNNTSPSYSTAVNLGASASGNMSIVNTGALNLSASSGGSVVVSNTGNVTIQGGNAAATTFTVTTTPDQNGNGAILIGGSIGSASSSINTINLSSSSSGSGAGGIQITGSGGILYANTINLSDSGTSSLSNAEDIGSASNPIITQAISVSANTSGHVWLGGTGTRVYTSPDILLPSLDFTDPSVIADVQKDIAGGYITGNFILVNGQLQAGSFITIQPSNLVTTPLSGEDIPAGLTASMQSFSTSTPLNISIGQNSYTSSVVIAGSQNFVGSSGVLNITSNQTGPVLIVSGSLHADNALNINANGDIQLSGNGAITGATTLSLQTTGSIIQTSPGASLASPSMTLTATNNIGSAGSPVNTQATNLTANAGSNVYIQNTGSVSLVTSSNSLTNTAGGTFQLSTSGNLSLGSPITANNGSIILATSGGGNIVSNGNNIVLSAGNNIDLSDVTGIIDTTSINGQGGNVQLTAGTASSSGSIIAGGVNVQTGGGSFTATAAGNVTLANIITAGSGGTGGTVSSQYVPSAGLPGGNGGNIVIQAGSAISTGSLLAYGGGGGGGEEAFYVFAPYSGQAGGNGGNGGSISLGGIGTAAAGSITVTGDINSSGGGGGGGGGGSGFVGGAGLLGGGAGGLGGSAQPITLNASGAVTVSGHVLAADGAPGGSGSQGAGYGAGGGGGSFGGGGGGGAANVSPDFGGGGGGGYFGGGGGAGSGGSGGGITGGAAGGSNGATAGSSGQGGSGGDNWSGGLGAGGSLGNGGEGSNPPNTIQGSAGSNVPGWNGAVTTSTQNNDIQITGGSVTLSNSVFGRNVNVSTAGLSNASISVGGSITGSNSITLATGSGGNIVSNGGNIVFSAGNNIDLSGVTGSIDTTTPNGQGGSVQLLAGTSVAGGSIIAPNVNILTSSSGSGNFAGGNVTLTAGATGSFSIGTITSAGANGGSGGNVQLTAGTGGTLTAGTIMADGGSSGNGGSVIITGNTPAGSPILDGGGISSIFADAGPGGTTGGTAAIINLGAGGITVTSYLSSFNAGTTTTTGGSYEPPTSSGTYGQKILDAGNGPLTFVDYKQLYANGSVGGGSIYLRGSSINTPSGIDIEANGSGGSITIISTASDLNFGQTLSAPNITLVAPNNIGSAGSPVNTQATNLTASAGNNVYIQNAGSVNLVDSASANGTITNAAGGTYYLSASGNINNVGATALSAPNIVLQSSAGDIGSVSNPFSIANTSQTPNLTASASGNVFVQNRGSINLVSTGSLSNAAGGTYQLSTSNNGNITLLNNVTASNVALSANGAGLISAQSGVIASIPTGNWPWGSAVNSAGTLVYVTNQYSNNVSVINTATNSVVATIPVGTYPLGVALNAAGTFAYVTDMGSNSVSVIDTSTNSVVATVPVGANPIGVVLNAAGTLAYVANQGGTTVSVIDTGSNTVVASIPVGSGPYGVSINPSGSLVYVANNNSNSVSVISTANNSVVATIPVGAAPIGITVNQFGTEAYVANSSSNTVSVINTTNNTVVATVPVGTTPFSVGLNQAGTYAYVPSINGSSVSVINTANNTVTATVPVGSYPLALGNPVTFVGSNVTAYLPITNAGAVAVMQTPAIVSPSISLSSGSGDINVGVGGSPTLTVSTAGNATITAAGNINLAASTVGQNFLVGSSGNLSTSAAINAGAVNFQAQNISVQAALQSGSSVNLSSPGQIQITNGASIQGSNVSLLTPNLNNTGLISATASSAGNNISVSSPAGTDLTITNGGSMQVASAANNVQLNSSTGNLVFNGSLTASGGDLYLTSSVPSLNVTLSPTTTISVDPGNNINFNPGSLTAPAGSITVNTTGQNNGTLNGNVSFNGNGGGAFPGAVSVNLQQISGNVSATGTSISINTTGALNTGSMTSSTGDIILTAPASVTVNGALTAANNLSITGAGVTTNANLAAANGITLNSIGGGTQTASLLTTDSGFSQALGITLNPAGTFAYVCDQGTNTVSVVNTATNVTVAVIPVGNAPNSVVVTPSGSLAYVSNTLGGTVSVINTATNSVVNTINVGNYPQGLALSPSGTRLYVANNLDNTVSVIDTGSNNVIATVPAGTNPIKLAVDPTGNFVYVSDMGTSGSPYGAPSTGTVSIISTQTNTNVGTVNVGSLPDTIVFSPSSNLAYVSCWISSSISVINTSTRTVVATIPVGQHPEGLAISPSGNYLFSADRDSLQISIYNAANGNLVGTVPLGVNPFSLAVGIVGGKLEGYVDEFYGNAVGVLSLPNSSGGNLTLGGLTSAGGPVTVNAAANITVNNNITAGGSLLLAANGNINSGNGAVLSAAALTLVSSNGQIGSPAQPILTSSNSSSPLSLTAQAQNSVSIFNNGDISLVANPSAGITNGASTGTWALAASGNIFQGDASSITAPSVVLSSANGQIGTAAQPILTSAVAGAPLNLTAAALNSVNISNTGDVSLVATATGINGAAVSNQSTNGTWALSSSGSILQGDSSSISAPNITLSAANNIGTAASSVNTQATNLTANAGGDVYIQNTGSLNLVSNGSMSNSAGGTYQLATSNNGNISLLNNITANNVALSANGSGTISTPDSVIASVGVGNWPTGAAVNPGGTLAYITNQYSNTVSVINTATNTVVATIPTGTWPIQAAMNPSGTLVYVPNYESNSVSVINTTNNTVVATIPVGSEPYTVAVNPAGTYVYVANQGGNSVSVISTATNAVVATVPVGGVPAGVAVNPSGTLAYVANNSNNTVLVINTSTNAVVATVPVGSTPWGLSFNPSGTFAYVANTSSNTVSVISTATNAVVATVPVGNVPIGVAVNPAGTLAYVSNINSNTVSVINLSSNAVVETLPVGNYPLGVGTNVAGFVGNNATAYIPISSSGSVAVIQMAAIVAPSIALTSGSGDINVGVGGTPNLTVSTTGNATITAAGDINLAASTVGQNFFVGSTGNLSSSGAINAGTVNFQATQSVAGASNLSINSPLAASSVNLSALGNIAVSGNITANGTALLSANGNISSGNGAVISAAALTLASYNGQIGSSSQPILTSSNNSAPLNLTAQAQNSVSIVDTGDVSLVANPSAGITNGSSTGTWALAATGNIFQGDASSITAPAIVLSSLNGQIGATAQPVLTSGVGGAPLNLTASALNLVNLSNTGDVSLVASATGVNGAPVSNQSVNGTWALLSSGNILQGDSSSISAPSITLSAANNIGTAATSINTQATNLTANAGGDVYIQNTGSVNLVSNGNLSNSAGGTYQLSTSNNGSITLLNNVNASNVVLNANGSGNISTQASVTATIGVGNAYGSVLSPDGSLAYVVNGVNNTLSIINTQTNAVVNTVGVGTGPSGVGIDPSGQFVYTVNNTASSVTIVNAQTGARVADIGVGGNPAAIAFNPTTPFAYVSDLATDSITVINTQTRTVVANINVGQQPYGLAVTPNGNELYVANLNGNTVSVINTQTNTVTSVINVGANPREVVINPSGLTAYVVNTGDSTVSTINVATNTVVQTTPVPGGAHGAAMSPTGESVYITGSQFQNQISIFNTTSNSIVGTITVPNGLNDGTGNFIGFRGNNLIGVVPNQFNNSVAMVCFPSIVATQVSLSSGVGNISATTNAATLSAITGGSGNVILSSNGNVTLNSSSAGGLFQLGSLGSITTNGALSGNQVVLQTTANNSSITVGAEINASTSATMSAATNVLVNGNISVGGALLVSANGNINSGNGAVLSAAALTLVSNNGQIGSPSQPLLTSSNSSAPLNLTAQAQNSVNIVNTGDVSLVANPSAGATNSSTGTWALAASGNIFQGDASSIAAPSIVLSSANGQIGTPAQPVLTSGLVGAPLNLTASALNSVNISNTGDVSLVASATGVNGAPVSNQSVNGTWALSSSGNILQGDSSSISAPSITLSAANNIGTAAASINTLATNLTANAGGDVYIQNTGSVNLVSSGSLSNSAGGTYQLTTINGGNISLLNNVTASNVTLNADGSGSISTQASVTQTVGVTYPYGAVLSANGSLAYVVGAAPNPPSFGNTLTIINTQTGAVVNTVTVGTGPSGVGIDPSGQFVYTVNNTANSVTIVNTQTDARIADIPVGTNPAEIAFSPNAPFAYVTDLGSNSVTVINTQQMAVVANIPVGQTPYGVAVTPDGRQVISSTRCIGYCAVG